MTRTAVAAAALAVSMATVSCGMLPGRDSSSAGASVDRSAAPASVGSSTFNPVCAGLSSPALEQCLRQPAGNWGYDTSTSTGT